MNNPAHILITDDDPALLRATSRLLQSAGYATFEAASGAECLRLAREQLPDLILLDVVVDDLGGVQVCQQIKADPALANIFIVLLSGVKIDSDSQAEGLESGADGYIVRPISNRELIARVQGMLRIKSAEDALRASEARFRIIAERVNDVVWELNKDLQFVYVSPAVEQVFGYTVDEAIGLPVVSILDESGIAQMKHVIQEKMSGSQTAVRLNEYRMKHKDGHWVDIENVSSPFFDTTGQLEGFVGISRDITERKRAEERLRALSARHLATLAAIPDIIMEVDNHKVYTWANQAGLRFFGEDVIGREAAFYFEGEQETYQIVQPVFNGSDDVIYVESWQRRHDGEKRLLAWWCRTLKDAQGNVTGALSTARDITEQKRTEQVLQESDSRLKKLSFHVPGMIYQFMRRPDGSYCVPFTTEAIEDIFGCSPEDVRDDFSPIAKVILPEDLDRVVRSIEDSAEHLTPWQCEYRVRIPGKPVQWLFGQSTPEKSADGGIIWHGFTMDITERKRAQAAIKEYSEHLEQMIEARTRELRDAQDQLLRQERLTVLGQLAGGIGHELRSPLGAIKNATYLLNLSLKTRDPDILETLDILKRQVDASDRIITSLLDFARAKPPYRREANVRELIDGALAQVGIPENIAIQREFDGALPDLSVDLDQLQIVFGNLIRNAVQAMPDGGKLTIAARQSALSFRAEREISGAPAQDFSSPNASRRVEMTGVEISFCDTGSGIAPDLMDKIFQPLFTTKARGMGLGLALCKLLVEGHDGKIQVTSQVGKGTTFVVYLPVLS